MKISLEQAKQLGIDIGINWKTARFSVDEFRKGIEEEGTEHDDVLKGNKISTAKIVYPHLKKLPDYYERLKAMEESK